MKRVFFLMVALIGVIVCAGANLDIEHPDDGVAIVMTASLAVASISKMDLTNLKIDKAVFDELKAKYGNLYVIDVIIDKDESYQFIVCRPKRALIEAVADAKDTTKINDMIIKNMVVGGDKEALDDGIVYSRVMVELGKILKSASGFLSKA